MFLYMTKQHFFTVEMQHRIEYIIVHTFIHCSVLPPQSSAGASSQWHHVPALLFINVWHLSHEGRHHSDRCASTKLHFIPDELLPEAIIRPHHGSTVPNPPVGLQESHPAVLHQVGHAQGGGAAHTCIAVHQCAASALCSELYFIRHLVKVLTERGHRGVRQRDVDVLYPGRRRTAAALGLSNVDDAGYVAPSQLRGVTGCSAITEIQVVGDSAQA